jgi:hypothetical protein
MWDANGENIVDDIAAFRSANERFEVDGANAAREFLRDHGIWPARHRRGLDGNRAAPLSPRTSAHAMMSRTELGLLPRKESEGPAD